MSGERRTATGNSVTCRFLDFALRATLGMTILAMPLQAQRETAFTHADTLRGSLGPGRTWWDVTYYDLDARINPKDSTVRGSTGIAYLVTEPSRDMQIDLQMPMEIDSVVQGGRKLRTRRDG